MRRLSFASIEKKSHPKVLSEKFDYEESIFKGSDQKSTECINELLNDFSNLLKKGNDGTGEWKWLQENKQNEFLKAMFSADENALAPLLVNMFRTEATYGYLSPSYSDAILNPRRVSSDILCNIDSCFEFTDLSSLEQLSCKVGAPYGLVSGDGVILPDSPRAFYHSHNISSLIGSDGSPFIIEIGGGYGGLCLQNWIRFKGKCTLVSVDLMPSLVATYYFLYLNGIPLNMVSQGNAIKENCVNLINASDFDHLSKLIPKCDLIFNSRSLCEMHADTVASYFDYINNCKLKYFYHENSNYLLFPDSERHLEVMADDFPVDVSKLKLMAKYITPFTGGDGRYREYIYKAV